MHGHEEDPGEMNGNNAMPVNSSPTPKGNGVQQVPPPTAASDSVNSPAKEAASGNDGATNNSNGGEANNKVTRTEEAKEPAAAASVSKFDEAVPTVLADSPSLGDNSQISQTSSLTQSSANGGHKSNIISVKKKVVLASNPTSV
jgi:hypothetical protein